MRQLVPTAQHGTILCRGALERVERRAQPLVLQRTERASNAQIRPAQTRPVRARFGFVRSIGRMVRSHRGAPAEIRTDQCAVHNEQQRDQS
jgi:hypothetical protein